MPHRPHLEYWTTLDDIVDGMTTAYPRDTTFHHLEFKYMKITEYTFRLIKENHFEDTFNIHNKIFIVVDVEEEFATAIYQHNFAYFIVQIYERS